MPSRTPTSRLLSSFLIAHPSCLARAPLPSPGLPVQLLITFATPQPVSSSPQSPLCPLAGPCVQNGSCCSPLRRAAPNHSTVAASSHGELF
ncbi:hypothetical protein M0R45_015107 [Rubus argutus]|uniref:Secreted protein n=1 Tax=Rubus argutus TaxID=59490 RepID=A0AAW1XP60_RUBAR